MLKLDSVILLTCEMMCKLIFPLQNEIYLIIRILEQS